MHMYGEEREDSCEWRAVLMSSTPLPRAAYPKLLEVMKGSCKRVIRRRQGLLIRYYKSVKYDDRLGVETEAI